MPYSSHNDIVSELLNNEVEKNLKEIKGVDDFFKRHQSIGSLDKALGNTLYGLNRLKSIPLLPIPKDGMGYVFFTRPQLNLSTANLRGHRKWNSFLTGRSDSIHRYVRMLLDPRLKNKVNGLDNLNSPLIDNDNVFIPIFSNTLKTLTGWPDIVMETTTTPEGKKKEQFSISDGITEIYNSFDLDATFLNIQEQPIDLLMEAWLLNTSKVFEGVLSPYPDFVVENELDYNTRIYRLVMSHDNKKVRKIASTIAAPITLPGGKAFDYNRDAVYVEQIKEINVRFKCVGAEYNDDVLIDEFNSAVSIFHGGMRKLDRGNPLHNMVKVPPDMLAMLNHRGYPRINPITKELEWWINKQTRFNLADNEILRNGGI